MMQCESVYNVYTCTRTFTCMYMYSVYVCVLQDNAMFTDCECVWKQGWGGEGGRERGREGYADLIALNCEASTATYMNIHVCIQRNLSTMDL